MLRCGTYAPEDEGELRVLHAEFEADVQVFVCVPPGEREALRRSMARGLPEDLSADVNAAYDEAMRRSRVPARSRRFPASTGAPHAPRGRREGRSRKAASSAAKQAVDEPPPRRDSGPASVGRLAGREGSESLRARRARPIEGLDDGDLADVVDFFRILNTWKLER